MKKIILAVTLLSLAFSFTTAQKKSAIKHVPVTAATIAGQPTGKAYMMDLTRKGTIYSLAAGIDYSQVRVRTSKGEMTMADLLKKAGKSVSGKLRVGMPSDMRTQKLGLTRISGGPLNYNCSGILCTCTGDDDCNDMFTKEACSIALCPDDGCWCINL
jgi:hypothetical protein